MNTVKMPEIIGLYKKCNLDTRLHNNILIDKSLIFGII